MLGALAFSPADKAPSANHEPAAKATSGMNGDEYVVQKGDTLSRIAQRFLGSADQWKQIADANSLQNPNQLSVGQKLDIPKHGSSSAAPASRSEDNEATPDKAQ